MQKNHKTLKKVALLYIALLSIIITWGGVFPEIASSQQLESRLNALEVDLNGIESRLDRIEAQLNQLPRSEPPRALATPPPFPINSRRNRPQLNRDQMFDRLTTLVIELKQQVNKLEARVSKLESGGAPRTTP